MKVYQYPFIWIFAFTLLFMLSLDFWRWKQEILLSFLNFPAWIFYFVGLNVVLVLAMYGFTRCVTDEQPGGQDS